MNERAKLIGPVFSSGESDFLYQSGDRNLQIFAALVSPNFVHALGLRLALGAPFLEDDDRAGRYPALLGYNFWQREFGGRVDVLGKTIRLRDLPFTITGVMPQSFHGMDADVAPDLYVPGWSIRRWVKRLPTFGPDVHIYGRLAPGATIDAARAEVAALYPGLTETEIALTGDNDPERTRQNARARRPWLEAIPGGRSALRGQFSLALGILMGAVGLLLLMVCANAGGLVLARSEARRQEIAVRLSLGATRAQIAALVIRESLILAVAGFAIALVIARWGAGWFIHVLPARRELAIHPALDWRLFLFASMMCAAAVLLMSAVPALRLMRGDLALLLARGGRLRPTRTAHAFVAIQVMLAMVLTAGGLALVRTLDKLRAADPGFKRERMVVVEVLPPSCQNPHLAELMGEVLRLPGVEDASLASGPLMRGLGLKNTVARAGERATSGDLLNASINTVTANHLANMGMRLLSGRSLIAADAGVKPAPAVVTASFARKFFPGLDPIGKRFGNGVNRVAAPDSEVVGVVADTKYRSMREEAPPTYFQAVDLKGDAFLYGGFLHVRIRDNQGVNGIRGLLTRRGLGYARVATLDQEIETSLWRERVLALIAAVFATLAALLSAVGLYGMLAQSIRRRRREFGIRMAIGASALRISRLVAIDVSIAVIPGMIAGLVAYLAASRILAPLLYGTRPNEKCSSRRRCFI